MSYVAVIDTGLCNVDSISRAIDECGAIPRVTDDPHDLEQAARIVLPGVGAFPEAMARLQARGLDAELREQVVGRKIPFLGICLGMQLLATTGTEIRPTAGLDFIAGDVTLLNVGPGERLPHIGWNAVKPLDASPLLEGIDAERDFYFVHSYVLLPARREDVVAMTPYGGGFVSVVQRDNIYGVQFHPEKSHQAGFAVLRNFLNA